MKSAVLIAILVVHSTTAFLFESTAEWNGLRVGFSRDPASPKYFAYLPRTTADATKDGWEQDTTVGCDVSGTKFNGNRYMKNNDPGTMLLFDKNGFIAGIQAGIPLGSKDGYPVPNNRKYHVFNREKNMYVVTAYFVEPADICTKGRSSDDIAVNGTGRLLSFQTGPSAASLMGIPADEKQAQLKTKFVEGKCYPGMGVHYWYNTSVDMPCDEMFPVFLLYDKGRLVGFGWAFNIKYTNSKRYEEAFRPVFGVFMKDVPKCLGVDGPVTTLHLYMVDKPYTITC